MLLMSEATEEKEIDGEIYKLKFEANGNFILKSNWGWASKGNKPKPIKTKEHGIKVDYDKRNAMKEAGERV